MEPVAAPSRPKVGAAFLRKRRAREPRVASLLLSKSSKAVWLLSVRADRSPCQLGVIAVGSGGQHQWAGTALTAPPRQQEGKS